MLIKILFYNVFQNTMLSIRYEKILCDDGVVYYADKYKFMYFLKKKYINKKF